MDQFPRQCHTFMMRTEAERLAIEHPECVSTTTARCAHCDAVREFFSDLSPEGCDYCMDLTADALDALLHGAGYAHSCR
jgi:hypothetical protein